MSLPSYNYKYNAQTALIKKTLAECDNAGHSDHWAILQADAKTLNDKLQSWLKSSLEKSSVVQGLSGIKSDDDYLLIASNEACHIKQIFSLKAGKPSEIVNIFPAVNSPYGLCCQIDEIIACDSTQDAILKLSTSDGTNIYAYDSLFAINNQYYQSGQSYYVNFGAWAYQIKKSNQDEIVLIDDPKAIRYHRAFNDIVTKNNGKTPNDIDKQIKDWQPSTQEPLRPVEINLGHSCIYLFGETFGQQDEAWCQGQVLGKSKTTFFDKDITLFDVVVLREYEATPFVIRIAAITTNITDAIQVQDYIQTNIWLQASIYALNQDKNHNNHKNS